MRTHSTLTLRNLILNDMNPEKHTISISEIDIWVNVMPDIIKEQFNHIFFFAHSIFGKGLVKKQFKQMQSETTILLDAIDKYQNLSSEMLHLKTVTIAAMVLILDELMSFDQYADKDMKLPAIGVRKRLVTVENEIDQMKAEFIKLKVDPELQKVILEFPNSLIRLKTWSNEKSDYLKRYMPGIIKSMEQSGNRVDVWLMEFLINNNHNSESFTNYLKGFMLKEINAIFNLDDRLYFITQHLNRLRKRAVSKKVPLFDKNKATIYEVMYNLLSTENSAAQSAINKSRPATVVYKAGTNHVTRPLAPASSYRVAFTFSVDSLAYFIKLMVNAGIIEDGIREQLFKYISRNFQTPGTANTDISSESFKTKYKNVTQTTAVGVRASLMSMLKLIDKEF